MDHRHVIVFFAAVLTAQGGYVAEPSYNYGYNVHDSSTGDVKSHQESLEGDVVKGSYSLLQPDGLTRTVHYTADRYHGFKAVVLTEKSHVTPKIFKYRNKNLIPYPQV